MIILDENRVISESKVFAGYDKENKAFTLEFDIPSIYGEYDKTIEFEADDGEKSIKLLTDNKYTMTRDITQYDHLKAQVIFKKIVDDDTIVLKSNTFEIFLDYSINADGEIDPDDPKITILDQLIDEVNVAINETNNLDLTVAKAGTVATVTITKKDGTTKIVEIKDGATGPAGADGKNGIDGKDGKDGAVGPAGKDATINGYNTINISAGSNINLEENNNNFVINANLSDFYNKTETNNLLNNKEDKTTISSQTSTTLQLANNNEYRYSEIASITITLPTTIDTDYVSSLVFSSGATATSFNYSDSIKWSGDDVTDNVFVPVASKRYNIMFWFDGVDTNAVVRGA